MTTKTAVIIALEIPHEEARKAMVWALASSGHKVWIEEKEAVLYGLMNSIYTVCYEYYMEITEVEDDN